MVAMVRPSEEEIVSKVCKLLINAGVPETLIKTEYHIWLGSDRPFITNIAIVDNDGSLKAVFEIKATKYSGGIKKEMLPVARLFWSLGLDVPFYAVCNNEVLKIVEGEEPTWYKLEQYVTTIKESLILQASTVVKSVSDYLVEIERKKKIQQQNMEGNAIVKYFFRGQRNSEWSLLPSLFRNYDGDDKKRFMLKDRTLYDEEKYLIQEAIRMFPAVFSQCNDDIDRIAVAQHYEVPTRLLDVTGNALVALYFAVQTCVEDKKGDITKRKEEEADGKVFLFGATLDDYRWALKMSNMDSGRTIDVYHQKEDVKLRHGRNKPQLVFSSLRLQRQIMQDSAFYLFENDSAPSFKLHKFEKNDFSEIIIDKGSKERIRRQLEDLCNISKGMLFPESLSDYKDKMICNAWDRIAIGATIDKRRRRKWK